MALIGYSGKGILPMAKTKQGWLHQPSWWIVIIAGTLFVSFIVAIVREVVNSRNVAKQVRRLQDEVAVEQHRQQQLQELIDYLNSPTFQEQEARLKLGLKGEGESVIVVPPSASFSGATVNGTGATTEPDQSLDHPQHWWKYFFGPRPTHSSATS